MKSAQAWILVTDSARARIFKAETPLGPLSEVGNLVHGEGRLHRQDLVSDREGRAFDSKGDGRHSMEAKTDPKAQEQRSFVNEIGSYLDSGFQSGQFGHLYIAAPSAMMGHLRDQLNGNLRKVLVGTLDKNLVKLKAEEIRTHLPEKLWMLNSG